MTEAQSFTLFVGKGPQLWAPSPDLQVEAQSWHFGGTLHLEGPGWGIILQPVTWKALPTATVASLHSQKWKYLCASRLWHMLFPLERSSLSCLFIRLTSTPSFPCQLSGPSPRKSFSARFSPSNWFIVRANNQREFSSVALNPRAVLQLTYLALQIICLIIW